MNCFMCGKDSGFFSICATCARTKDGAGRASIEAMRVAIQVVGAAGKLDAPNAMTDARAMLAETINANPSPRDMLEAQYGKGNVWETAELSRYFDVLGFAAPMVIVRRKSDGKRGSLEFQHMPRIYYNFVEG